MEQYEFNQPAANMTTLPHVSDAERSVLGSMLIDGSALDVSRVVVEPPRDGEVHVAFLAAVGGDGPAVLPTVPRVDDPDGLPCRRRHARLHRLRRQKQADGRRRQHEQQREYGVKRLFSENDKQNTPHPGTMYAPRRGLMCFSLYRTLNKKKSPASLFSPAA